MNRARRLARLNGRILRLFSRRTIVALRAALPMRLALPHLEPVLLHHTAALPGVTLRMLCGVEEQAEHG